MSEVPEETTKRESAKAEVQALVETVKAEFSDRLDQLLDEIGAKI